MNKIILTGRLGSDPEVRSTPNGVTVCSFNLAVDGRKEGQVTWFKINAWRSLGDTCARWLSKGKKVAVVGELQARTYEAKDGTTRMSLDVQADECEFLSPKQEKHDEPQEVDASGFESISSEDIPF